MAIKKGIIALFVLSSSSAFSGTMGPIETNTNFGGLYLGLGTGVTDISGKATVQTNSSDILNGSGSYSGTGGSDSILYTGVVGYGKMFNEKTYFGAKASIYYTAKRYSSSFNGVHENETNTLTTDSGQSVSDFQPSYNVDLMLGYEIIPHILPFVEGGVSFSNPRNIRQDRFLRVSPTNGAIVNNVANENEGYQTGFNVGIGSYFLVSSNWFFNTELVYTDMGKTSSFYQATTPGTPPVTDSNSISISTNSVSLFAGVSYLFPI